MKPDNYRRPLGAWLEAGQAVGLIVMVPQECEQQPVTVGVIAKPDPETSMFEEGQ